MSSLNARPYLIAADPRGVFAAESRFVRALDGLLVASLCLLLAFGPLAFGAVQEWAICTLEVGAALCVVLWAVRELAGGRLEVYRNALFLPILLFAALVGIQLLTTVTAYWYVTWQHGLLWAAYAMIFFVSHTVPAAHGLDQDVCILLYCLRIPRCTLRYRSAIHLEVGSCSRLVFNRYGGSV